MMAARQPRASIATYMPAEVGRLRAENEALRRELALHATPKSSNKPEQQVASRRLNTWAVGALAAAALSAVVGLGASPHGILGGNAQERWHDTPCPDGVTVPLVNASSRVLVTGGAGFIGMSLMASLGKRDARTRPAVVVGVDSFNDYYAPAMKRGRAARLKQEFGYDVVEADVCNTSVVDGLFEKYTFTHVVHLAAQAGVRYSITHPMTYARNNLECVVSLLNYVAHRTPQPAYVYASSSSVYGLNKKIPFSELHAIDHPANLYGISKFAGEQIAAAYHNLHGLKSVGLRFFTVYGPWGRPDMAVSLFTSEIENGNTITLFNGGDMRRDFTYVDDVVRGVEFAMEYCADNAAVFNLGNSKPVQLGSVRCPHQKCLSPSSSMLMHTQATSSRRSRSAWASRQNSSTRPRTPR